MYGVLVIVGEVYGNPKHEDGKLLRTTAVVEVNGNKIKTYSGSEYELGEPDCPVTEHPITLYKTKTLEFLTEGVKQFIDEQKSFRRLKAEKKMIQLDTLAVPPAKFDYPIYRDDVLVKDKKGYTKLTGVCINHLPIADDEVEPWDRIVALEMM
jgi:hypothetical protein